MCSSDLKTKARFLKLKAVKYCIIDRCLYWKNASGILLKCFPEFDAEKVKQEFHEGECGVIYTGSQQPKKF